MTVATIFATVAVAYGVGNHTKAVGETGQVSNFLFYAWMAGFWFDVNIPVGKLSPASLLLALHAQVCE